jgi:hypothetical protein
MKTARGGSASLTVGVLATTEAARQRWSGSSDSDGRLWTGRQRGLDERCRDGRGEVARGGADSGGGAVGTALSGRRRAVLTSLLTRWRGTARGV